MPQNANVDDRLPLASEILRGEFVRPSSTPAKIFCSEMQQKETAGYEGILLEITRQATI